MSRGNCIFPFVDSSFFQNFFSHCLHFKNCRLDGIEIGTVNISSLEKPRSIAVHSTKRLLFWSDVGRQQSINCARIDGAEHIVLAYNLSGITAIAVDQQLNLLFFAYNQRIDVMNIDGSKRYD